MSNQQEFTILIDFLIFFSLVSIHFSGLFPRFVVDHSDFDRKHDSGSRNVVIQHTNTELDSKNHHIHGQQSCWTIILNKTPCHIGNYSCEDTFFTLYSISIDFFWQNFGVQLGENEDDINLVESQENEKDIAKSSTKLWRTFGNLIDRILFASLSIAYFIMTLSLLPEKYFDEIDVNSSVSIVGY